MVFSGQLSGVRNESRFGHAAGRGSQSRSYSRLVNPDLSACRSDGSPGRRKARSTNSRTADTTRLRCFLVKDGVIEAGIHMHLLDGRTEALEKFCLGGIFHDPIAARREEQRRRLNNAGISHDQRGKIVQVEQHIHGNRAGHQRIGFIFARNLSGSCVSIFAFT